MDCVSSIRTAVFAVGFAAISGTTTCIASPISTALFLNIDSSGSISNSEYALQVGAYETLLGEIAFDGSLAIGALQFSSRIQEVFPLRQIASEADRNDLVATFASLTRTSGSTDIAGSIETAAASLTGFTDCISGSVACLIDVSTDGAQTVSGNPSTAAANAIASGVDAVNCLGVGSNADCSFIAGEDSFSVQAESFDDFETALRQKLAGEGVLPPVQPPIAPEPPNVIPIPASILPVLTGVAALFGLRRLRKSTV